MTTDARRDRDRSFWSKRAGRVLGNEAVREISVNLRGFFDLLEDWDSADASPPEDDAPHVEGDARSGEGR